MGDDGALPTRRRAMSVRGRAAVITIVITVIAAGAVTIARRSSTPGGEPDTAATAPGPIAPLTGLADPSGAVAHRCAVTVKIGNTPESHPQSGLEQADVVYEEVVDGGITRLAAVFQSQAPDRVGPVRSVRPTDQSLVWPLRGIFAYSGGNPEEVASISAAPVTKLDEDTAGTAMVRDPTRIAPHNLYARVDQMYLRCTDPPPPPLFTYRPSQTPSSGAPVSSVRVGFDVGYDVTWTWDDGSSTWHRSIFGADDLSAAGTPITAANVVVMPVRYAGGAGGDLSEATLTGQGPVSVFTDGKVVEGNWTRPDRSRPAHLLDNQQHPIALTPGQTWVELPDASYTVVTTP